MDNKLISTGIKSKPIDRRKQIVAKFTIAFSLVILTFFTFTNYYYQNMALFYNNAALMLFVSSLAIIFRKHYFLLAQLLLLVMSVGILLIIHLNQGQEYVAIWTFVSIYISMVLFGHKKGVIVSIIFCCVVLAMLYLWVGQTFNMSAFLRFSSVLAVSILFSYISERQIYKTLNSLIETQHQLEKLNKVDSLTNIYNRRKFDLDFEEAINAVRRGEEKLAFAMIDIDFFKLYNDHYGHPQGDKALRQVAQELRKNMRRATDAIYRLGGEEFGLLYYVDEQQEAKEILSELKQSIELLHIEHKPSAVSKYLTISAGLYIVDKDSDIDTKLAYKLCDELLYKAKSNGRNQIYSL